MHPTLTRFQDQVVVFSVCGDAEAFVFDFDALAEAERAACVATHLQAFEANLVRRKRAPWSEFEPFALLGTSMPSVAQAALDLSAPHEGALLRKRATGGVFYVAAADDLRAFHVADDLQSLQFRESGATVRGPAHYAGTPTQHTGFTLDQYAIGGNRLAQVIGKHGGLRGLFERMFASS